MNPNITKIKMTLFALAGIALLVVFFVFFKINNINQQASVITAITDIDLNLDISTNTTTTIQKGLFGAQIQGFFDSFMYDKENPAIFDKSTKQFTPWSSVDSQNVYSLGLNNFRYGGTSSRYYHTSLNATPLKGYGINPDDIGLPPVPPATIGTPPGSDRALYGTDFFDGANPYIYVSNYQNYLPHSFTEDLATIANSTGPNRTVTLVANLVYGTPCTLVTDPCEVVQQIADLQNAGVTVAGVEMGNEHYTEILENGISVPDPGLHMDKVLYLDKAKKVAKAIKNAYPNIEVGLVAARALPSANPSYQHFSEWDIAMANAMQTEMYPVGSTTPLFDFYSPHIYRGAKCNPLNTTYFTSIYDPAVAQCARYKITKNTHSNIPTDMTWGSLGGVLTLDEAFAYYRNIYGASTPIWITQWGLSEDEGGGQATSDFAAYTNTLLFAAYMPDFYNYINKYNQTYGNVIKVADYHNLTSWFVKAAISSQGNPDNETFVDTPSTIYPRRTPWFGLKVMKPIYNLPNVTIADTVVTMTPQSNDYLNLTSYLDTTNNDIYVYFSNMSGLSAKIPYVAVDGWPIATGALADAEIVSGPSLFTGNGATYFDETGMQNLLTYNTITSQNIESITIPGFSFGYIKFAKPVVSGTPVTGFTAVAGNQTAILSWNPVPGAIKYQIWRNGVFLKGINASAATYVDSTVTGNTTYTYKVRAKFSITNFSAYSPTRSVIVPQYVPPPIISNVSSTNITTSGTVVSWTTNELADTQVFYGISNAYGDAFPPVPTTSMSLTHSVNISTLQPGTLYHYAVKSRNAGGALTTSADQTFTTLVIDTQSPTVNITAPAANAVVSGTVTISADASDNVGVTKVEFYRGTVKMATVTAPPYSYDWDTTSTANSYRTITAKAYDAVGNTTVSAPVTIKVKN